MNVSTCLSKVFAFPPIKRQYVVHQLLNLGCPCDLLCQWNVTEVIFWGLLTSIPLASIFHLGTQLPQHEIQIPLLERVDTGRNSPGGRQTKG